MSVKFATPALIAMDALSPDDQRRISNRIHALEASDDDQARSSIHRLEGRPGLYVMRGPQNIRILFRMTDDGIEVLDLVLHERLQAMYG